MYRTTKIEATAWAEAGPATAAHLISARGGAPDPSMASSFYLDIRGTVALAPGTALPTSPEAALQMRGRMVLQPAQRPCPGR